MIVMAEALSTPGMVQRRVMAPLCRKELPKRQVIKRVEFGQMSLSDVGDRKRFSDQEKAERLIMPTELQDFQDMHGLIKSLRV
jgi:hypothetical protein